MKPDLHMHSTGSDGTLTPTELVHRVHERGFDLVALTDHDSVSGVPEAQAAGEALGVRVIAGSELSCGAEKEIHILGYGLDTENAELLAFFAARRANREARAQSMAEKLAAIGRPISMDYVREIARGVVGRPHIARALMQAGHCLSVKEAFDRFIGTGKPGYVPKEQIAVAEAVRVIHGAGGAVVLAHPMELRMSDVNLISMLDEWTAQGLDGVECHHPSATPSQQSFLCRLAKERGLLVTGGSDFHGAQVREIDIGSGLTTWSTAEEDAQALLCRIARGQETTGGKQCRD